MEMIRHEAIRDHGDFKPSRRFTQQTEKIMIVFRLSEDTASIASSVEDMVDLA
jgi:hypothetical protein